MKHENLLSNNVELETEKLKKETYIDAKIGPGEDLCWWVLSGQVAEEFMRSFVPLERVERRRVRGVGSVVEAT